VCAQVRRRIAGIVGARAPVVALAGVVTAAGDGAVDALVTHVAHVARAGIAIITITVAIAAASHGRVEALVVCGATDIASACVAVVTRGVRLATTDDRRVRADMRAHVAGVHRADIAVIAILVRDTATNYRRVLARHADAGVARARVSVVALRIGGTTARDRAIGTGGVRRGTAILGARVHVVTICIAHATAACRHVFTHPSGAGVLRTGHPVVALLVTRATGVVMQASSGRVVALIIRARVLVIAIG